MQWRTGLTQYHFWWASCRGDSNWQTQTGLPIGMQIVGKRWRELLTIAQEIDAAVDGSQSPSAIECFIMGPRSVVPLYVVGITMPLGHGVNQTPQMLV